MIVVTGAGGFLGRSVVKRLIMNNEKRIRCCVRSAGKIPALLAIGQLHPEVALEIVVGNLLCREDVAKLLDGASTVYHLAAGVGGCAADMFLNSVVATQRLMSGLQGRPTRFVMVSSFGVYASGVLPAGSLISESTPLESNPEQRDPYSHSKLRQEALCREYSAEHGHELVILRPGVIYGPGGTAMSPRVGVRVGRVFLRFGRDNALPLTYVENCGDAIVFAGTSGKAGEAFNIVDDDVPRVGEYLRRYTSEVEPLTVVWVPYAITQLLSRSVESYHHRSRGQIPSVLTPYKSAALWRGHQFSNLKIKSIGWHQPISTAEALDRTFESFKAAGKP